MKKLLLFCFLVSGSLMAMEVDETKGLVDLSKTIIEFSHFTLGDNGAFNLTDQAFGTLNVVCKNESNKLNWDKIKGVINDIANFSFQYGSEQGYSTGHATARGKLLKSLCDSGPKKAALGIVTLIVVSSVAYTGFSLFRFGKAKFKKLRGRDTE
jgi:hypothetical protein